MSSTKSPVSAAEKSTATNAVETQTAAPAVLATPPVKAAAKRKTVVKTPAKTSATVAKVTAKPSTKATAPLTTDAGKKPASKTVATPAKVKAEKAAKDKKPKLVRDSFTIPKLEYSVIDELKQRSGKLGHAVKKSEILRAGIKALARMSDAGLLAALKDVPAIKTGRPAKD